MFAQLTYDSITQTFMSEEERLRRKRLRRRFQMLRKAMEYGLIPHDDDNNDDNNWTVVSHKGRNK